MESGVKRPLKILVITARFPPDHLGGYGLRIKEITDGLSEKWHKINVLTTINNRRGTIDNQNIAYQIHRKLHDRSQARFFPNEVVYDLIDTKFIDKSIKKYEPDVIYLGHIYNLSKVILPYLADVDIPIVFDEGGSGLIGAWTDNGRWFQFTGSYRSRYPFLNWLKPLIINIVYFLGKGRIKRHWQLPRNMRVFFNSNSNYNRTLSKGVPVYDAKVIHSGIDIEKFSFKKKESFNFPLTIICPGRIEPRKGQKDALHLVAELQKDGLDTRLVIVGPKASDSYYEALISEMESLGIEEKVIIIPMVSQEKLIDLYHQADICFFPSYWSSGFSRIPLEAMACGCLVISYGNEASSEIISDRKTGFLVEPKVFGEIVNIVEDLRNNNQLYIKIIQSSRIRIEENFSIDSYINKIENIIVPQ